MTYPSTATLSADGKTITIVVTQPDGQAVTTTVSVKPPITALVVSPSNITFNYVKGGALPPSQQVTITTIGTWKWTDSIKGFNVSAETGSGNTTLTLKPNADLSNLAVGVWGGKATVTSGSLPSQQVQITINVTAVTTQPVIPPGKFNNRAPMAWFLNVPYQPWDTPIGVIAFASDGIQGVQFSIDGGTASAGVFGSLYDAPAYVLQRDATGLANGQHIIAALVTTKAGTTRTLTLPVTINAPSANFRDISGQTLNDQGDNSIGGPGIFVRAINTTFNRGGRIFYVDPNGWKRQVYCFDCVTNDVQNGFRNCGMVVRSKTNRASDDAASDVKALINFQDLEHQTPSGSHGDVDQMSAEPGDAPDENVIWYNVSVLTNNVQGLSGDMLQNVAMINCTLHCANHWGFYTSRGGMADNLYFSNVDFGQSLLNFDVGGITKVTDAVIEKCSGDQLGNLTGHSGVTAR